MAESFGKYLPYWTTLRVPVQQTGALAKGASLLILKDGTVCMGLKAQGLDVYGCDDLQLNAQTRAIGEALRSLPSDCYIQTVFETGHDFGEMLDGYAQQDGQEAPNVLEVLRRGRREHHQDLSTSSFITRSQITYWIGWPEALAMMVEPKQGGVGQAIQPIRDAIQPPPKLETRKAHIAALAQIISDSVVDFMDRLRGIGIGTEPMNEEQILEACHRVLNPTAGDDVKPPRYVETWTDRLAYLMGKPLIFRGPSLSSQLPLSSLRYNDTQITLGEPQRLFRAIGLVRFGDATTPKSLHEVMFGNVMAGIEMPECPYRLVITHRATDEEVTKDTLDKQRRRISSFAGKMFADYEARAAVANNEALLEEMATTGAKLFKTSFVLIISGDDDVSLDNAQRSVLASMRGQQLYGSVYKEEQFSAWKASLPGNGHKLTHTHDLLHSSCAHLFPYWTPGTGDRVADMIFENRQRGLEGMSTRIGPIREFGHACLIGALGSGKTLLVQHIAMYGFLAQGGHVIVADTKGPENSTYKPLCGPLGGLYVCLKDNPDVSFNPFPRRAEVFSETGKYLFDSVQESERILCMMAQPGFQADKGDGTFWTTVAREVLKLAYEGTPEHDAIVLQDVVDAFDRYKPTNAKRQGVAHTMRSQLELWLEDPRKAQFTSRREALDLSNRFIVFDFFGMDTDKHLAGVLISILSDRARAKMRKLPRTTPKGFLYDEAWSFLDESPEAGAMLGRQCREGRSFCVCVYIITQNYNDIAKSAVRDAILSNTSLRFILRHLDEEAKDEVASLLKLTERQCELLDTLHVEPGLFGEFLLVDKSPDAPPARVLRYYPTPFDYWCTTSRPRDVELRQKLMDDEDLTLEEAASRLAAEHPNGAPETNTKVAA